MRTSNLAPAKGATSGRKMSAGFSDEYYGYFIIFSVGVGGEVKALVASDWVPVL
jgi:hypothetical protein